MADVALHIEFADAHTCESSSMALGSQSIDFGALDAYWTAIGIDCDDRFEVSSGCAIAPQPISKGTTAKTIRGLTLAASDGERLGRMAWIPGA